ncbi:hypothetical protein CDL15_Pgr027463 [Punica granatum]|uniref:Uncharacterized protein n=1 Tax=Punica granatum TaxID=22663 RepID=A0A218XIX6_PUNGR|nr:hypothetical protein CDL15_Pgr027463 [Punica granatum]PKI69903.1 hypothetical protein CRG98_009778 [Punica granatum]
MGGCSCKVVINVDIQIKLTLNDLIRALIERKRAQAKDQSAPICLTAEEIKAALQDPAELLGHEQRHTLDFRSPIVRKQYNFGENLLEQAIAVAKQHGCRVSDSSSLDLPA